MKLVNTKQKNKASKKEKNIAQESNNNIENKQEVVKEKKIMNKK